MRSSRIISILVVGLLAISVISTGVISTGFVPDGHVKAIVVYKDKIQDSDMKSLEDQGSVVKAKLEIINGVAVELPKSAFDRIAAEHGQGEKVKYIVTDDQVHILDGSGKAKKPSPTPTPTPIPTPTPSPQTIPWGISDINVPQAWLTTNGSEVKIAVIDTGIDYMHPDLAGKVIGGHSFVSHTKDYMDDNGHGTHVAGIIAALNNDIGVVGVAPGASLYAVKVLDSTGNGYLSDVIDGIQWSVKNNAQVISMSLGLSTDNRALHDAVDAAYNSGVLVIAAAGNTNGGAVTYPAAYSSVIAVSAIDINNSIASFGSVGPQVELAAPGVNVYSTYLGGGYATKSGTSMACPHVSGTVVLILATPPGTYDQNGNGKWEPAEVRKKLDDTATDLGAPGLDPYYGYGLVNAANATI